MVESYFKRAPRSLPPELEAERQRIAEVARRHGLDFFETVFEMCDYDEINMLAAYGGFPTRYPHWRWGMEYLSMQRGYEYGLQKIYEMVINTNPSYAYLLDNNMFVDQKLVMAHVFGHVDFFKNNAWFGPTNRKMLDAMANHASRVRRIIDSVGETDTEAWLDTCLACDNLIDPFLHHIRRSRKPGQEQESDGIHKLPAKSYMDSYINPPGYMEEQAKKAAEVARAAQRFPEDPVRDVLGFVLEQGRLSRWQRDCLEIVRDEAYYFAPQAQTKVANEGWASFWHTKLMTTELLTDSEVIDYCDHHSGTVAMRPGQFNPYKIGIEIWRDIERRWNRGQFGKEWIDCEDHRAKLEWDTGAMLGKQKLFEVRRTHNDVTLIDEFFTEDLCRRVGLFTYEFDRKSGEFLIESRDFEEIKKKLLFMLSNHGTPRVYVTDANHANRGELELTHEHEGTDIQLEWATHALGSLSRMWGRPVHLVTRVEGKQALLHHDGQEFRYDGPKITGKR
ncbi:MAG: SpoVR family protein [Deltaproteobacteria bacterium]|nr:SpoVR family protein [Deltaproteobacteria bacterium]